MPIGVEHALGALAKFAGIEVFLPVMPIGVEHQAQMNQLYKEHRVFLPVMPIGVEHDTASWNTAVNSLCSYL